MLTDNILTLIGNTPLLQLKGESVFAKAEFLNPGGSIKDRVALAMIEGAEPRGPACGGPTSTGCVGGVAGAGSAVGPGAGAVGGDCQEPSPGVGA